MSEYDFQGKLTRKVELEESNKQWQHSWHLVHRVRLHEELQRRATSPEGEGEAIELRTSSRAVDVDPHSGNVILENGEQVHGDVIVGADGVHVRVTPTMAPTALHVVEVEINILASPTAEPKCQVEMSRSSRLARARSDFWSLGRRRWTTP